jgi:hypothetical protein
MEKEKVYKEDEIEWVEERHDLSPVVVLMTQIIENQLDTIEQLAQPLEEDRKSPVYELLQLDRMVVCSAALKVIRRMQDRLLKLQIDLPLDDKLMSIGKTQKEFSQPMVNDSEETQAE